MGERMGNSSRKESMGFRVDLLTCSVGIFMVIFFAQVLGIRAHASSVQGTPAANKAAGKTGGAATPQAGCGDKSKRYADCGNGTVADTATGLTWLKQVDCLPAANWEGAKKAVAALKDGDCMLKDGSKPGDWRLPTNAEFEATMKDAKAKGCSGPMLTNDAGDGCLSAGGSSFTGADADYYWSNTPVEGGARIYFGDLDHGNILNGVPTNSLRVWPVRGGQR